MIDLIECSENLCSKSNSINQEMHADQPVSPQKESGTAFKENTTKSTSSESFSRIENDSEEDLMIVDAKIVTWYQVE